MHSTQSQQKYGTGNKWCLHSTNWMQSIHISLEIIIFLSSIFILSLDKLAAVSVAYSYLHHLTCAHTLRRTNNWNYIRLYWRHRLFTHCCVFECLSVDCQSLTPCHTNNNYYYELLSIGHLFSSRFRVVIFICTVESIVASRLNCHCCSDGVHLLLLNQQSHNAMIVVLHVIIIARPMQLLLWSIGQLNIYMCFAVALNDSFIYQLCKIRLKLIPIIRWWDERFC